jgi:DNA invertase Pin-like site-specific DNA recombinase
MEQIVAYIRVSTVRQGQSGLGLDAQKAAIETFASQRSARIIGSYMEVETGKVRSISNRPQLQKAIAHARRSKATLVVPKLDRLSRNVAFVSALLESNVGFVAVDFPQADTLTLHILAAMAEHEARMISNRTKAALAQAKQRGIKLGASNPASRNLTSADRKRGAVASGLSRSLRTADAYAEVLPQIELMRKDGLSFAEIAERLNAEGHSTAKGAAYNTTQVFRLARRMVKGR